MAKLVLTNASVTIGGVDLSAWVTSVTLDTKYDILETTAMNSTAKTRIAGLADNSITVEFLQDFATSAVEQTIYPLLGTATTIVVIPQSPTVAPTVAVSALNPRYTVSALVTEWSPLKGGVGELASVSVSWPVSGAITKASV